MTIIEMILLFLYLIQKKEKREGEIEEEGRKGGKKKGKKGGINPIYKSFILPARKLFFLCLRTPDWLPIEPREIHLHIFFKVSFS